MSNRYIPPPRIPGDREQIPAVEPWNNPGKKFDIQLKQGTAEQQRFHWILGNKIFERSLTTENKEELKRVLKRRRPASPISSFLPSLLKPSLMSCPR